MFEFQNGIMEWHNGIFALQNGMSPTHAPHDAAITFIGLRVSRDTYPVLSFLIGQTKEWPGFYEQLPVLRNDERSISHNEFDSIS